VARYRFLTTWCVEAPIDDAWNAIHDTGSWPSWWKGVVGATKLRDGDENDIGAVWRYTWRSRLPYDLEFDVETTRVERPYLLEGRARGELSGVGTWRLFGGRGTAVVYDWNVETTRRWMNALAPLARPVFAWNHDVVMRQGGRGLARLLGAELVAASGG
jgi:hypothetical protein